MSERLEKEKNISRRDFLGLVSLWSVVAALFGSFVGLGRFFLPRVTSQSSSIVRLGKVSDFPPGTTRIFTQHKIRVVSTEEGVAAMMLICTHLGCIVTEVKDGFLCPCHGSKFGMQGDVKGGPAPRPLQWVSISQTPDGTLVADCAKEVEPGKFYAYMV